MMFLQLRRIRGWAELQRSQYATANHSYSMHLIHHHSRQDILHMPKHPIHHLPGSCSSKSTHSAWEGAALNEYDSCESSGIMPVVFALMGVQGPGQVVCASFSCNKWYPLEHFKSLEYIKQPSLPAPC